MFILAPGREREIDDAPSVDVVKATGTFFMAKQDISKVYILNTTRGLDPL